MKEGCDGGHPADWKPPLTRCQTPGSRGWGAVSPSLEICKVSQCLLAAPRELGKAHTDFARKRAMCLACNKLALLYLWKIRPLLTLPASTFAPYSPSSPQEPEEAFLKRQRTGFVNGQKIRTDNITEEETRMARRPVKKHPTTLVIRGT